MGSPVQVRERQSDENSFRKQPPDPPPPAHPCQRDEAHVQDMGGGEEGKESVGRGEEAREAWLEGEE